MYGFSDKPAARPGACFACGLPGHWASDCPDNPNRISAAPRLPTDPAQLAARQHREPSAAVGADVVPLLRAALISELRAHTSAYLCGYAAHLSRAPMDSGWGCGYRNLQMLSSFLLARRPDVAAVLFGGCGWLPDIPSLQAWLEAAWADGFDPPGRAQLGGGVQGTPKWVGTPEVAVVLRQFGVDARIVDFCGAAPPACGAQWVE
ncbi:MAG: peptidase family C78-domain-containing protein [Monoraphidium minutum]|nr:MAG: peptidase family C78-domain-containing protein [Monoraphidium minutum]